MSWRTKGKGKGHKHFQVQSSRGDGKLPPKNNYDYSPKIDEKQVVGEIREELIKLDHDKILSDKEVNKLASGIFNQLLKEAKQGKHIDWKKTVRETYEASAAG